MPSTTIMRPALHGGTRNQRSAHDNGLVDSHALLLNIEVQLVYYQAGEHQHARARDCDKESTGIFPVLVCDPEVGKSRQQVAGSCYEANPGVGIERQEGLLQPRMLSSQGAARIRCVSE